MWDIIGDIFAFPSVYIMPIFAFLRLYVWLWSIVILSLVNRFHLQRVQAFRHRLGPFAQWVPNTPLQADRVSLQKSMHTFMVRCQIHIQPRKGLVGWFDCILATDSAETQAVGSMLQR